VVISKNNQLPQQGQLVLIRKRPAIVRDTRQTQDQYTSQALNLLQVEYIDGWDFPSEDNILWQREVSARVLSDVTLPNINAKPDFPDRFSAFIDAIKWSSIGKLPTRTKLREGYEVRVPPRFVRRVLIRQ
jgi:hypothetical protein